MSQLVTRCPNCSTSFHVNEEQLRAARGAVRCGSCLQVFRADENIVFSESSPGAQKDLEALLEDDDFLIHDDIELEGEDNEPKPPTMASDPEHAGRNETDEPLIGDAFGDTHWQDLSKASTPEPAGDSDDDESAFLLPDDNDHDADDPWGEPLDDIPRSQQARARHHKPDERDSLSERLHEIESHAAATSRNTDAESEAIHASPQRDQLISSIEPAPLEVRWQPERDRRVPGWLWWLLALLMLAGLLAQFATFRFDTLSKQEPWRALYSQVCPQLGCQLPELIDTGAIRTSNLVVRSHPQQEGALVVDAVLLNTAGFDQPFPALLLTFSDLKNRPVASRIFTPREYLQGELAGRTRMPAGNPVHIGLEIVDPGPEAVNYQLQIAPAEK
ncbi:DUF3426 domain-containing protein [Microbulbifer flavimaris]|uniref:DUF3426 domain-containing protein n=1 Tax=Microbulbifer flavimaris TaxID=1781068 RepID=A0ABX4HY62_9GAMM|nr:MULTISPECIES: DUF3426 domain-containing protein [Microbulbifer]KUJ82758.1 hypothetical protein AVO43_09290 [Microbulbifer sp. ZGT114]PCO04933.1 DUF3426 domain-containing protein [Microbulbifer flavimaris]